MSVDDLRPYLELDGICRNPVFIIGSPRSGTTALARALGRHPELWVSKESYVLHQLYGKGRIDRVWRHNWERATPSWLRAEGVERAEFFGFLGLAVNALFSSRSQGRRWVDQTPLYTLMAEDLADMFPGASFLHIVRDGRSVVRSMANFEDVFDDLRGEVLGDEMPPWANDFRLACETWADCVESAWRFGDAHPERCLAIRNEDLSADLDGGFARIHAFLGVEPTDAPAVSFGGARINSSFRRGATRPSDTNWDDWAGELRRTFVEIAGRTLVRAGYASAGELETWAACESV
jgi:Sulfotransferase family